MPEEGLTFRPVTADSALPGADEAGEFAAEIASLRGAAVPPPWCSYLVYEGGNAVGFGGFKGPPGHTGEVEIGYLTFASQEGRGIATQVAAWLVTQAQRHGACAVCAHTLPKHDPSTRVLAANRFVRDGWGQDEDVGEVWRWCRSLLDQAGAATGEAR